MRAGAVSGIRWGLRVFVVVLAVATAAGFLDRANWVFEPATLFRLQYAVLLVVFGGVSLAVRQPRLAVTALVLAGVNIAATSPWENGPPRDAYRSGPTLRIVSFNAKSLRSGIYPYRIRVRDGSGTQVLNGRMLLER